MYADVVEHDDLTPGAQHMLEVASQLFYDNGIYQVGVDTIAAEAEVTKPILYKNFGSKDGLVAAYLKRRHQLWWERLERAIDAATSPRVLVFFDLYAEDEGVTTRGDAFLNAAAELSEDHPAYPVIRYHKHSIRNRLEELVREDVPGRKGPARLAQHLFLLLEGAFVHRTVYGKQLLAEARDMAAELLDRPETAVPGQA